MAESKCIFCQIAEGKMQAIKIYEDRSVLAVLDINPASEGHLLIMPKAHFETLEAIPDDILSLLFKLVKILSKILRQTMKATGINVYASEGKSAGQRVPHSYINLIPSYDKEPVAADWQRKQVSKEKLEEIGNKMMAEAKKEASKILSEEAEKIKAKAQQEKAIKEKTEKSKQTKEAKKIKSLIGKRIP